MNRPLLLGMDCEAAQLQLLTLIRLLAPHHFVSLTSLIRLPQNTLQSSSQSAPAPVLTKNRQV